MGYRITARAPRSAEILLYADIGEWLGGIGADRFTRDLRALGRVDTIRIRINSRGGDAFDGLAIYQHLRQHPARKVVEIDSIAASIASVIAMAGDEIRIAKHAQIMIHEAASGGTGPAAFHRDIADRLEAMTDTIAGIYADRTKRPLSQIREWMAAGGGIRGTYFSAQEAVSHGFANDIADVERIAAYYDPEKHSHIGAVPPGLLLQLGPRPQRDAMASRVAALRARITTPPR